MRNFLIALSAVGLIGTTILYFQMHAEAPKIQPIVKPAANPFASAVAASGIVEAASNNIEIGTPVSGIIQEVYVTVWEHVKKGQKLFSLDDRELMGQLYVQEANLAVTIANREKLANQLERLRAVQDPRAVSKDEVATRQHEVEVANAQVEQAKAQVAQTKLLLERITVTAPKDGVILKSDVRGGEFVQAAASAPVMILGEVDLLQIRVDVDEQNASRIRPDQEAVAFPKNNTTYMIPLQFVRIEPYVIPKKSLTGSSIERVDTRVLQIIYSFPREQKMPIYVGQQMDVFIQTPQVTSQ